MPSKQSMKALLEDPHESGELIVTPPHSQWLELPEDEQVYSERAIEHAVKVLRRQYKHPRVGRLSPSGLGYCQRKVLFSYVGAPQVGKNLDSEDLMAAGTQAHLWWQVEGLSYPFGEPYMLDAEVWVYDEKLNMGGSIDAVLVDGSLFELKTVAWSKYNRIMSNGYPEWEHLLQLHAYFVLSKTERASLVYVDRNTGQFREFRVVRDDDIEKELMRRISSLHGYINAEELPKMLDDCEMRKGYIYKDCQYRRFCPAAGDVLPMMAEE